MNHSFHYVHVHSHQNNCLWFSICYLLGMVFFVLYYLLSQHVFSQSVGDSYSSIARFNMLGIYKYSFKKMDSFSLVSIFLKVTTLKKCKTNKLTLFTRNAIYIANKCSGCGAPHSKYFQKQTYSNQNKNGANR